MGNIKINGNNKELTNLSHDAIPEQIENSESQNNEFKVDTNLLENPEALKSKVIHNLS